MKRIEERPPQAGELVYRGLLVIAAVLALVLIIGTIYGLVKKGEAAGKAVSGGESAAFEGVFSGLGTMRIATADPEPKILIISIAFPYDKNDRPFSEELASSLFRFREATSQYLGAFTAEALDALDTVTVNKELLSRYNSVLRLGEIKELYILEYMLL
ncbi:MAG: flagellar basal body protein FliL [Spirochaetaceae bacterium]|jgi:flagellar basal body-associated protein FliL|nr:flagellar basal body protein FliL [Spirochaetaceae bacterium]